MQNFKAGEAPPPPADKGARPDRRTGPRRRSCRGNKEVRGAGIGRMAPGTAARPGAWQEPHWLRLPAGPRWMVARRTRPGFTARSPPPQSRSRSRARQLVHAARGLRPAARPYLVSAGLGGAACRRPCCRCCVSDSLSQQQIIQVIQ